MRRCYLFLSKSCPTYYDTDSKHMHLCHKHLHEKGREADPTPIANYKRCRAVLRARAMPCILRLQNICQKSTMRAAKVVRPAMQVVPDLFRKIPHLKVIHLVRDARDVATSRMLMQSAHSHLAERELRSSYIWPPPGPGRGKLSLERIATSVPVEAALFCNDVLADISVYKSLSSQYPRSLVRLRYEDYISSPVHYAAQVYNFVGLEIPQSLKKWINSTVSTKSQWKWKTRNQTLMGPYFQDVVVLCKEFYSELYPELRKAKR